MLDVIDAHEPSFIFVAIDKPALLSKYVRPDPPDEIAYRYLFGPVNAGHRPTPTLDVNGVTTVAVPSRLGR